MTGRAGAYTLAALGLCLNRRFLMISFVIGAVVGSVVVVVVPKAYAFVAAKIAAVKAKV